jgi:subtilisin family serine protease
VYLDQFTGRGVRIAVVDSGVHAAHPHVRGIAGGIAIRQDGTLDDDYVDRLGHGTAVTAAICEKAPEASIFAIKVFQRALTTDVLTLVRAIDVAILHGAAIVNLSLGTANDVHADELRTAVLRARDLGVAIVSAAENDGVQWLPGSLDGVVPVQIDWSCDRDAYRVVRANRRTLVAASGYPRDIPGVPRERNLKGISFAVANATGFLARAVEASADARLRTLFETLEASAPHQTPG